MARNIDAGGGNQGPDAQVPPGPQLPEPPAPTTLGSALGAKWRNLGGMSWGQPSFKPQLVPGGQYVTFTLADNSANVTMYSSAAGAFVVTERINTAWRRLGQHGGTLGFPASDELPCQEGGRYQHFQNGMVVWHPSTGAFVVQGSILAKYTALGGSGWGYPITDETRTKEGWFNHFRNVDNGSELSIYATSQTGTVAIVGVIRQKWASMDWKRGPLGYPTTDELPTGVDSHGRYTVFQHGLIVYHPSHGTNATFGPIHTRYGQLGGAGWGYPVTDVTALKTGGQYLHLLHPTIGDERSSTGTRPPAPTKSWARSAESDRGSAGRRATSACRPAHPSPTPSPTPGALWKRFLEPGRSCRQVRGPVLVQPAGPLAVLGRVPRTAT